MTHIHPEAEAYEAAAPDLERIAKEAHEKPTESALANAGEVVQKTALAEADDGHEVIDRSVQPYEPPLIRMTVKQAF